jgi:uncharacterized membrane protein YgdD (TMEM256/DUF423 family)
MRPSRFWNWFFVGAALGALAVACGAFGAHGLKSRVDEQQLANWETAARYQMYHALALLAVGFLAARRRTWAIETAGFAMTIGTLIFSGCLYLIVLTGQRWLGMVVPFGGTLLIVGWIALAVTAVQTTDAH